MTLGRFLLFVLLVGGSWQYWHTHKSRAPALTVTAGLGREWDANGYHIVPLEKFDFEARVLGTEHYSTDRESDLSPVDLALGWGPMASETIAGKVSINQSGRYYSWHVKEF